MTDLAKTCFVPGSNKEYFDCCNAADECKVAGVINIAIMLVIFSVFATTMFSSSRKAFKEWITSGENKMLVVVLFFHVLSVGWRILLYVHFGWADSSVTQKGYITVKSSAVGDEGSSLVAITVWLLFKKYQSEKLLFDQSYYRSMWILMMVYFAIWGTLYY